MILAVAWVGGGTLLTILALRAQRESDPQALVSVARQAAFAGEEIFAPAGLEKARMGLRPARPSVVVYDQNSSQARRS